MTRGNTIFEITSTEIEKLILLSIEQGGNRQKADEAFSILQNIRKRKEV